MGNMFQGDPVIFEKDTESMITSFEVMDGECFLLLFMSIECINGFSERIDPFHDSSPN
jgi:hypothetical protein